MNKLIKKISNYHLWGITGIFIILTIFHYPVINPFFHTIDIISIFGLSRHAIERILFIIPVIYAGFMFGMKGGIAGIVVSLLIMLPRIFFISEYPKDALIETIMSAGTGILIVSWIGYRRREIKEKEKLRENIRLYADQISKAHETERKRIARDLHDDTIQTLIAISRNLDNFISRSSGMDKDSIGSLKKIQKNIDESLIRIRLFIQDLRPPTLEHLGLLAAVRELANQAHDYSETKTSLSSDMFMNNLSADEELLIYRIIQEAVRNIWKHSEASHAEILIKNDEEDMIIEIKDNGKGFDMMQSDKMLKSGKLGLMGMKERAHLLGGGLEIFSERNKGTKVLLTIPKEKKAHD